MQSLNILPGHHWGYCGSAKNAVSLISVAVLKKKNLSSFRYPQSTKNSANFTDLLRGRLLSVSKAKESKASASKAHRWPAAPKLYSQPWVLNQVHSWTSGAGDMQVKCSHLHLGRPAVLRQCFFARLKSASVCSSISPQVISMDHLLSLQRIMGWQLLDEEW